jgi:RHS repeat-associated protein
MMPKRFASIALSNSQSLISQQPSLFKSSARKLLWLTLICCALASSALAQNIQFTQGTVSSGLDDTLTVPLTTYPGRGATSLPINLHYSSKVWRLGFLNAITATQSGFPVKRPVTEAIYSEFSRAGWTTSLDVPIIEWPKPSDVYSYTGKPCQLGLVCQGVYPPPPLFRVARVFIHMSDGSAHELRKSDQPYQDTGVIDMTGTFYAVDGSRLRYDSTDIDTGTLYLPDGSKYVLDNGTAKFIDHHGNTLYYNFDGGGKWRDTLGREVGIPLPANPQAESYTYYTVPGFNNSSLTYTLRWRSLSNALTPVQGQTPALKNLSSHYLSIPYPTMPTSEGGNNFPQPATGDSLFSTYVDNEDGEPKTTYVVGRGQASGLPFNPVVLTEIILPNGMKYQFSYNIYGEIDKVIYPTGGYELYQYNQVDALGDLKPPYSTANRGVTQRQLSADGTGNSYATWQYSAVSYWTDGTVPQGSMKMKTTAPDGMVTVAYRYDIKAGLVPFDYEDPHNGLVFDERVHAPSNPDGSLGVMLRRKLTGWEMTTNTVTSRTGRQDDIAVSAYRNLRQNKEVSLILDTGASPALAKTVTCQYDTTYQMTTGLDLLVSTESQFANVDQSTAQTAPIGTISPGTGTIVRTAETTYQNSSTYRNLNILGLATSSLIKDANGNVVAKTDTLYDEPTYPVLTYSDVPYPNNPYPDWTNPGTNTPRGNATTVRHYYDIANSLYLDTHAQFDQCGNLLNSWNERGIQSHTDYSSTYRHVYATQSTSAVPDPSGAHGSNTALTSSSTYDYTTGRALSITDVNGQVTTYSYTDDQGQVDPLNRVRKVTRPDGGWSKTVYNDVVGNIYIYVEAQQDATRLSRGYQYFDAMGRVSRAFVYESGTTYIITDTQYDQMGRVLRVSSPYRGQLGSSVNPLNYWTTNVYDALGRVISATFSDTTASWTVQTAYQGVYTTVTDQALKKRRQKLDSLGQIVRIDEPDNSGSLDTANAPATNYDYDTLGNLIHIAQGSNTAQPQHRYFKYDALGRLTYERQVEQAAIFPASDTLTGNSQWSRRIVYDETIDNVTYTGLMTSMYDARNIRTQSQYDQLNRAWQVTYSDATPALTNNYDQARTGYFNRGRVTETITAAVGDIPQTSQVYDFDFMGRMAKQTQSVGSNSYSLRYAYNLGGQLVQETYPSGRTVNFGYDEASRLSNVNGGGNHNFISAMAYAPQGTLASATMGNDVSYSCSYNTRLQLSSINATKNSTVLQKYEYKYGAINTDGTVDETKNNGQVARVESWIGTQKQWQQRYAYDSLGRLSSAKEYRGDNLQQDFALNYDYDLFGNRYQFQASNDGNPFTQKWVEANDIDKTTNRFVSSVAYDAAGNIISDTRFHNLEYLYDANDRQKQSSQQGGVNPVKAIYDGTGQRVATQINGVLITIMVYDATSKLIAEYGQAPPATASLQYVMMDHQGSTRLVTSSTGTVVSRHDYQPFGEELGVGVGTRDASKGFSYADNVRQKYTGMETDDATGLGHTLWRKYDEMSGRWTSPDPYGGSMKVNDPQSFNRYSYVGNDPINQVDLSGLERVGADQSWEDVENGFWGSWSDSNASHNTGQEIIRDAELAYDAWAARYFQDAADVKRANKAIAEGNYALALAIVAANDDLTTEDVTVTFVENFAGDPSSPAPVQGEAAVLTWTVTILEGGSVAIAGGGEVLVFSGAAAAGILWLWSIDNGAPGSSSTISMNTNKPPEPYMNPGNSQTNANTSTNVYSVTGHYKKVIAGLLETALEHTLLIEGTNSKGPDDDRYRDHWRTEAKAALKRAKHIASKYLRGNTRDRVLSTIADLTSRIE